MTESYVYNVAARLAETVARYGDSNALLWSRDAAVTFAALNARADQVARLLVANGVRKGDRVGIRLDKCTLAYAALLGCLKVGAPYFFIDPSNPQVRAQQIVDKCRPVVVFSAVEAPLAIRDCVVFDIDARDQFAVLKGISDAPFPLDHAIIGTDPAYIMFTSGSTGTPKGAVMSHANVLNFVAWVEDAFAVSSADVLTNVNPLYFDNSVFDIYGGLFNGAAIVPFDAATMKDPYRILGRIDEMQCTFYFSVPSLLIYFQTLKQLTPGVFRSLRAIVFGGEGYPKAKLKDLYDCFHDRARIVNVYGPTECTCICSAYDISPVDFETFDGYAPLGRLIPNFSAVILTGEDQAARRGDVGELCLSGPCVGLGYVGDPALTAQVFRQNPLNGLIHERIYCTGDLVRESEDDGKLHFIGRKDNQIKHQGHRIELAEIEHALGRVEGVDEAVAIHTTRMGLSQIVAVVAARPGLVADIVRREMARFVPAYMVPGRIDIVERLPKNANGKIDRNLLKTQYC